ncbi:efflux RND transporter periplasmic adaptor subunit [Pseudotabrizicola algicola]|uniref:Efflux RND transporter periplasmic adaptor subunit n=1 Tax=Pseudotabrizicola algicola TaxID=2709381 RepID=A0A6B3RPD1_9RHOB|nr:efflux RND transporter periplasmic adaptor subunit [Pseudotabrizicola algicola]NEX47927.1 efflux RND transporter periplasmic adaptor subunit [Pseudotabrizicola algicola]
MAAHESSRFRKALRRAMTPLVTILVFGIAGATGLAGYAMIARQGGESDGQQAPLTPVGVMRVAPSDGYTITRRFTGQVEAATRADLGFEFGGRITELLVGEGDLVTEGSILARLDISALLPERAALEAELAALQADAELARLTLARNDSLTERGFRSVAAQDEARLRLVRLEAGMAALRARIAGVDVRLEKSVLRAPFAARIGQRLADPGQTVAGGQPVLVLFDAAPPKARVGLPAQIAARLRVGDRLQVDIGGTVQVAQLIQIRPDLDPGTRSRSVILGLPGEKAAVLGDTVALLVAQQVAEPGFWAPLGALREGARGSWSVMAVETTADGDRTLPAAVEVIHTDGARVYLRGLLPAGGRIVAEAPARVTPGQIILAQAE